MEDRHEAQFVDDQQAEAGQIPLQVEQSPLVPGFQRSALPRRHGRDAPARFPSTIPQPVYFTARALLDHRICRMVTESGAPAWASPSRRSWLETALFTAPAGNSPLS